MQLSFTHALFAILATVLPQASASTSTPPIVGVWSLSSAVLTENDTVTTTQYWGSNPCGIIIYTASGYFVNEINRRDIPLFPSNATDSGTPEDNKAVVVGTLSISGTYTVDKDGVFSGNQILGCTFPNYIGQKRDRGNLTNTVSEDGTELHEHAILGENSFLDYIWKKEG